MRWRKIQDMISCSKNKIFWLLIVSFWPIVPSRSLSLRKSNLLRKRFQSQWWSQLRRRKSRLNRTLKNNFKKNSWMRKSSIRLLQHQKWLMTKILNTGLLIWTMTLMNFLRMFNDWLIDSYLYLSFWIKNKENGFLNYTSFFKKIKPSWSLNTL